MGSSGEEQKEPDNKCTTVYGSILTYTLNISLSHYLQLFDWAPF